MTQEPSEPGFTVIDRRRRGTEDVEPRRESPPAARVEAPRPGPAPGGRAEPRGAATRLEELAGQPLQADLSALCLMLYSEALVHLGQVADPVTGDVQPDLGRARFTIDLLGVLQAKTEGRRTPEESALLQEMLSALRMEFVRASRLR